MLGEIDIIESGASGRTRTDTLLRAADFESAASTNFATLAPNRLLHYTQLLRCCNNYLNIRALIAQKKCIYPNYLLTALFK